MGADKTINHFQPQAACAMFLRRSRFLAHQGGVEPLSCFSLLTQATETDLQWFSLFMCSLNFNLRQWPNKRSVIFQLLATRPDWEWREEAEMVGVPWIQVSIHHNIINNIENECFCLQMLCNIGCKRMSKLCKSSDFFILQANDNSPSQVKPQRDGKRSKKQFSLLSWIFSCPALMSAQMPPCS